MGDLRSSTAKHFESINFSELKEDFIDKVTKDEYTKPGNDSIKTDISTAILFNQDAASCLDEIANVCDTWCKFLENEKNLNDISGSEDFSLWKVLEEIDVSMRQVLGLIYLLCYKGANPESSEETKVIGLKCTKFYFNLLRVPGSAAYSVYHPNLLSLCINCFCVPEIPVENRITSEWNEVEVISPSYASAIESLIPLLNTFHFGSDSSTIEVIIQKLSDLTSFEWSTSIDFESLLLGKSRNKGRNSWSYLVTSLAYKALFAILKTDLNGDVHETYGYILACLRKHLSCSQAKKASSIPHKFLVIKDNVVSFMLFNLEQDQSLYSETTLEGLYRLCFTVCDKTEFRSVVAQSVLRIMGLLLSNDNAQLIKWLLRLSDSIEVNHRVVALDVLCEILIQKPKIDSESVDESFKIYATEMPIIFQVLTRCDDVTAAVRARALSVLSQNAGYILEFLDGLKDKQWKPEEFEEVATFNGDNRSFWYYMSSHRERLNEIASLLIRRNDDSNVNARKAALQALGSLISFDNTYVNEENLELFNSALDDKNIVVRKQMIQSIAAVLESLPTSSLVQDCWLRCILPLVQDPENTVQVKALSVIEDYFLCKIFSDTESEKQCAFDLLKKLTGGIFVAYQKYLLKAFSSWKTERKLRPQLIMQLEKHLSSENEEIIWFYISMFAAYSDIPSRMLDHAVEVFCRKNESITFLSSMEYVVTVLELVSKKMSTQTQKKLRNILEKTLAEFSVPVEFISLYIICLREINKNLKEEDELKRLADEVVGKAIESLSCAVFKKSSGEKVTEDVLARKLRFISEMCHFYPSYITENLLLVLKAFVSSSHESIKIQRNKTKSKVPNISPTLQSHAFTAIGKLCLQDENFAKELLPLLAKEMQTSKHGVIRSTVVVIMIEIGCKRYTSYADKYIPMICQCFKDQLFIVRFQAVVMIISLLQEDYIKWKSTLFFCLLSTFFDKKDVVKELAKYCLSHLLTKKNPAVFYDRFMESIFVFNGFQPEDNRDLSVLVKNLEKFSLKGPTNRDKRVTLYAFLLQNMPYFNRFCLVPSIKAVFDRIAEGVYPLNKKTESMVKDCFMIVTSKEFEFRTPKMTPEDSEENDEGPAPDDLEIAKLLIIDPLVPSVVKLYNCVVLSHSKIADDFIPFLTEILRHYKSEVKSMLSENFCLLKGVESELTKEVFATAKDKEKDDEQCQTRMSMQHSHVVFSQMLQIPNAENSCPTNAVDNASEEGKHISLPSRKSRRKKNRRRSKVNKAECDNSSDPSPSGSQEITQVLSVPAIAKDSEATPRPKASSIPFSSTPRVVLEPLKLPGIQNLSLIETCDEEDKA